ncbi:hypothetical protein CAPTEDRAFT_129043 [Capitella teleta]|uniref:Uncharacterized protein n=1 Tax=Capitella teleta TaxID=283909 RepID=R7TCT2_CAPTE|nr:hypothetical protein CAPTEDRAFT_129043 [Capitella teleta]|eukprot:ELT91539.1 hypothetical protein CAPTEDRAFT_129043 [Capitella teleta]
MTPQERPLSPHLQVYRWSILMTSSILHRMTGVGLALGFLLLVVWLACLASGPEAYAAFMGYASCYLGLALLFFITWALMHHMLSGVRHLIWDVGLNFDPAKATMMALAMAVIAFVLTLVIFAAGFAAS